MKKIILFFLIITTLFSKSDIGIYDFEVKKIDGGIIKLEKYKNKVMLIVNVASKCAFTSQYEGLEKLHKQYNNQGLALLGFPSNQFLSQEPGSDKEIALFCRLTYGVDFDMFAKIDVNGGKTHPLYVYLKEKAPGFLGIEIIKWNFTKFLVDKQGKIYKRYSPSTEPKDIEKDIIYLLKKK